MTKRVRVDFNARTGEGLIRVALSRLASSTETGEKVTVFDLVEAEKAEATVEAMDPERNLAYLRVDWSTFGDDFEPISVHVFDAQNVYRESGTEPALDATERTPSLVFGGWGHRRIFDEVRTSGAAT